MAHFLLNLAIVVILCVTTNAKPSNQNSDVNTAQQCIQNVQSGVNDMSQAELTNLYNFVHKLLVMVSKVKTISGNRIKEFDADYTEFINTLPNPDVGTAHQCIQNVQNGVNDMTQAELTNLYNFVHKLLVMVSQVKTISGNRVKEFDADYEEFINTLPKAP